MFKNEMLLHIIELSGADIDYKYVYKKKFAFWPTKCKFNRTIWLKFYYQKIQIKTVDAFFLKLYCNMYNLTSEDCVYEKLTENH